MFQKQTAFLIALVTLTTLLFTSCGAPSATLTTQNITTTGFSVNTQGLTGGQETSSTTDTIPSSTTVMETSTVSNETSGNHKSTHDNTTTTMMSVTTHTRPTASKTASTTATMKSTKTTLSNKTTVKASTTVSKPNETTPDDKTTVEPSTTSTVSKPTMPAVKQETPPNFPVGFITTETTYIETKYVLFEIEPNIYVIGDLAKKADTVCAALEKVSGLSFETDVYGAKKALVHVGRSCITGEEEIGDVAHSKSGYFTSSRGDECANYVYLNPMELFLGKGTTFLHEMAHVLRFRQMEPEFRSVFEEGFATFTEYQTIQYLEKHHTDVAYALDAAVMPIYSIPIDENLYAEPIETWLKKDFEYDTFANNAYAIGFRLLAYLKDRYGDPYKWITASSYQEALVPAQNTIDSLKSCYGKTVLSDFYEWLKQHETDFDVDGNVYTPNTGEIRDLSGFAPISFYPRFLSSYNEAPVSYLSFRYKDLYINLEEVKRYLSEYKGRNVDNCYLSLSHAATVILYNKQGKVLDVVNGQKIAVKGVSYIKLVGSGYMGSMHLDGYYKPTDTFDKSTVFYEGTLEANGGSDVVYYGLNEIMLRSDLEIWVVASSPLSNISFEAVYWDNFTSYANVTEASCVGGCRTISLFNQTNKDVTVKVIATKK